MNSNLFHIIGIICAIVVFTIFSFMHHYNWLLPATPTTVFLSVSSVAIPDILEENSGEDDVDHEYSDSSSITISLESKNIFDAFEDLFVPQISTPPPDYLL